MAKSYADFKAKYIGRHVDVDGFPASQPYQCWDLVSGVYFPYIDGFTIHCGVSGYVKDIANQRATNGILKFCFDVGLNEELQQGDICIWTNCSDTPYSHIAIYDSDSGQDAVYFFGQNQPYNYCNIVRLPVRGIIGVFRPKIFVGKKPEPAPHKPDQILRVGSKVKSWGFYVQKMDYQKGLFYNDWVGGWIPWGDVDEVDAGDGRMDQIIHIGSGVAFNKGVMTVTGLKVIGGKWCAKCDKLGYWVSCACLNEVED